MKIPGHIKDAVALAWASVEEADLPSGIGNDFQLVIFTEVLRRALDGEPMSGPRTADPQLAAAGSTTADPGLARLAVRLAVPGNALADVFAVEDDSVTLYVPSARISTTTSPSFARPARGSRPNPTWRA